VFSDREDAGQQLARALGHYLNRAALVLAIPRGGVEIGYAVARLLNADLSLIVTRKLPYPDNPESGFGAISEDASVFIYPDAAAHLSADDIERIKDAQHREIERRIAVLRRGQPLPDITGRTVILVDDGIAMGSTMRASIELCKNQKAGKIVVAVPVAGERALREIRPLVDEMIVLESPPFFRAVAQVYEHWYDVSDCKVLELMAQWQRDHERDQGNSADPVGQR
jgi:putative phosphoribosyl transferase